MDNFNTVMNIALILLTAAAIIFFMLKSRQHKWNRDEKHRLFLEAEDAANAVRKRDIDEELFFEPDLSDLPAVQEGDPFKVERFASRKMIYFRTPMSNLELKQQYGPAQMDYIAQYEENFNEFLKSLTAWAADLADSREFQDVSDALLILGYAIAHGSEFRTTYKLAADLYAEAGETATLEALMDTAERHHFRDPAIKRHIVDYIDGRLKGISA